MGRTVPLRPRKEMSTIINNIDMENNNDYDAFIGAYNDRMKRLTDMVAQQKKSTYAKRTCQVASPKVGPPPPRATPYDQPPRQNPYAPTATSRQSTEQIEIARLTEENTKLKKQYGELVNKANHLVEAYRNLKTENDVLTLKKAKVDAKAKTVADTKKVFADMGQKFMTWLKS